MPMKFLKLKKSKQHYNVANKSIFVITVELLDNAMLECTLTAESTGRDCMDNVCQRLGLQQPDLFGLRYVSRRSYPKIRWVDLDRPLKKQLDKYAQEMYLYLSVMFYVNDVSLLEDEVTRYHYFLQLKMDVIEGRLRCDYERAIVLASYSLQAEFGDHDPGKHTLEYLQNFPLLPKPMLSQFPEEKLGTLTEAIISQHASLRGIAQQLAEVYYIVGAQQLDGYGQECFLAKDDSGNEVLIGASLTGIVVRKGNVLSPQFLKWIDITNLVNHKRYFGIECQNYEFSVQFLLDEPDSAKYVWKMCVLQHTFYKMHASASESNELNITLENNSQQQQQQQFSSANTTTAIPGASSSTSNNPLIHQPQFDIMLEQSGYPTTIQHSEIQNFQQQTKDLTPMKLQYIPNNNIIPDPQQSSTLSYSNYILRHSNNSVNNEIEIEQAGVVGGGSSIYRKVPDYETAIRNKYGIIQNSNNSNMYNSQPSLVTDVIQQQQQQYSANLIENHYQNNQQIQQQQQVLLDPQQQHFLQNAYSSTPELNRMNLNSQVNRSHALQSNQHQVTSNNNNNNVDHDQIVAELQRLNLYKAPPPYPGSNRLASTSTPDLAGVTNSNNNNNNNSINNNNNHNLVVGIGGSSPDLVSRRNLGMSVGNGERNIGNIHKTFENLYQNTNDNSRVNNSSDYRLAYSTEELNSVYHLDNKNHLNLNAKTPQQLLNQSCNEPIYQNQQQILDEIDDEPIYENLPVHEKILYKQRMLEKQQQQQQLLLDNDEVNKSGKQPNNHENVPSKPQQTTTTKLKGHVSRVAITNSRENLHQNVSESKNLNFVYDEDIESSSRSSGTKELYKSKSVTKISIGGESSQNDNATNPVAAIVEKSKILSQTLPAEPTMVKQFYNKDLDHHTDFNNKYIPDPSNHIVKDNSSRNAHAQGSRTPGSKPRAGRKRWALNFGSKTGSLKSVKSDSGSHKSQDSLDGSSSVSKASGFGPMMLATLHGLTRSRPDLLAESMATFSQPSKMPKDEIGAYLEAKLVDGEVLREFECIPKKKIQNCNFNVASLAENIPRSRFMDVLPYDENRVKLSTTDKENRTGFINASHVSASVDQSQRFYIAAQGPLPNTVLHFWQMIFQSDVHLIVMLTDVSASTKTSNCIPYWPQKNGSTLELGDFKIVKKFTNESGSYTTSTLHVTHLPSKKHRTLWHLQYSDWSDHGCPSDVKKYIEFLEELAAIRTHTASEVSPGKNRNPPVLVHCSAGVGRTGVTILCDILLYCVDHNLDIDIPKVLTHLRQQRMLMVQTIAQYKFVHTVLICYLKQSRLI